MVMQKPGMSIKKGIIRLKAITLALVQIICKIPIYST